MKQLKAVCLRLVIYRFSSKWKWKCWNCIAANDKKLAILVVCMNYDIRESVISVTGRRSKMVWTVSKPINGIACVARQLKINKFARSQTQCSILFYYCATAFRGRRRRQLAGVLIYVVHSANVRMSPSRIYDVEKSVASMQILCEIDANDENNYRIDDDARCG